MRCTLYEFSIFILSWKIIITNNYVNFKTDGNVILNVSKIDVRVSAACVVLPHSIIRQFK